MNLEASIAVEQKGFQVTPEGRQTLLDVLERKAESGLTTALSEKGIGGEDPAAELYRGLSEEKKKKPWSWQRFKDTLRSTGQGLKETLWGGLWGKVGTISIATGTALGVIREAAYNPDAFRVFFNNLLAWSFTSVEKGDDPLKFLSTATTAAIILAIPTLAVATVTTISQKQTERYLARARQIDAVNGAIENGEADLNYLVGPCVHILVGKSDPSVETLTKMFHEVGIEVITFWDEIKTLPSSVNRFWLKTRNLWTRSDILNKASLDNLLCMFGEISRGSDVLFSRRRGTFSRMFEDMSDAEGRNANKKVNFILRKKGRKQDIPYVAVTNEMREVQMAVAGDKQATYGVRREKDLYRQNKNMHVLHVDGIGIGLIGQISQISGFPMELSTDLHRQEEYGGLCNEVIADWNKEATVHNKLVEADGDGAKKDLIRYKVPKDEKKTLTCFYGDDDQATLRLLEGFLEESSTEGDILAIINDPEMIGELPEEIRNSGKYLCLGEVLAKKQFRQFVKLVESGVIILPNEIKTRLDDYLQKNPQLFSIKTNWGDFNLE